MFLLTRGPIPPGHVIDHDCHNQDLLCSGGAKCMHRRCWRPDHLRAIEHRENVQAALPGGPPAAAEWVTTYEVARALGYIPEGADAATARVAVQRAGTEIWQTCGVRTRELPRSLRHVVDGRRLGGYYVPSLPQHVRDALDQAKSAS